MLLLPAKKTFSGWQCFKTGSMLQLESLAECYRSELVPGWHDLICDVNLTNFHESKLLEFRGNFYFDRSGVRIWDRADASCVCKLEIRCLGINYADIPNYMDCSYHMLKSGSSSSLVTPQTKETLRNDCYP